MPKLNIVSFRLANTTAAVCLAPLAFVLHHGVATAQVAGWAKVANSADTVPETSRSFNSFSQPSINSDGLVVFRARSKGGAGAGEPVRGIYTRHMGYKVPGPLKKVFDNGTLVPQPNNLESSFTEFPAFPRIGVRNATIATRGQSQPVWKYLLPDGTETRAGTSGIYIQGLSGSRISAATQLGVAPGLEYFGVPGAPAGTKFDQFPGAPALAGAGLVAFKGNYTIGDQGKTGIFFRSLGTSDARVGLITDAQSLFPSAPAPSTAPPSASRGKVVFVGLDNEDSPTSGGIYLATILNRLPTSLSQAPLPLTKLIGVNETLVPGETVPFNRIGESLSYDGRYIGFWAAWGTATTTVTLTCPQDGQASVIAACLEQSGGTGVTTRSVPSNQGFFVLDSVTKKIFTVAKSGSGQPFSDFLYWVFSGRPSGVGESESEDFEPPRWRSAAFIASFGVDIGAQVSFKGRTANAVDGIYLTHVSRATPSPTLKLLVDTTTSGSYLDMNAPAGSVVSALGIERDGLRNGRLAITASMLNSLNESWAGVYLIKTAPNN